jgi:hypothetical protein
MAISLSRLVPDTDRCLSLRRLSLLLSGMNRKGTRPETLSTGLIGCFLPAGELDESETSFILARSQQQNRSPYQFARDKADSGEFGATIFR